MKQPADTEEYVESSILEDEQWHKEYDESLLSLTDSISHFLKVNTVNSLYTLCTFLTTPDIIKTFRNIPDIAHCLVAANITATEFNNNITTTLYLKDTYDISGVIKKNNYYKFLLLNIEYNVDRNNALNNLTNDIRNKKISHIAIEQLVKTTSLNSDYVLDCLSNQLSQDISINDDYTITDCKTPAIIDCNIPKTNTYTFKQLYDITDNITYNNSQFCFIICSNNNQYETECIKYINNLTIPDGYTIDIIVVHNASSMTSGYNKAMLASHAKYKIYLHQDVFIINKNFLSDILREFENPCTGVIGIVGSEKLPQTCIMWYGWRIGHFISNNIYHTTDSVLEDIKTPTRVEAIDGFIMITQYDIPWREDIFTGWDFYDISQSFEFRKRNYDVIIPPSVHAWCFHDDGIMNLDSYYNTRKIFMKEYADMLQ